MLRLLKNRWLLAVLGLAMLAVFIWFVGPLFGFAGRYPLESGIVRWTLIGASVAFWAASILLAALKARRASDRLAAAVVRQSQAEPQPSAEALQLRERFEEAVSTLKQKRRRGTSLYELPWFAIVGAPGSGKTTALVNSGLHFPLEQRTGKGALRGIGGTRNCDWWFTDEAVFLDTAGRYLTQDSDPTADSAAWKEFLSLLRKYRKRRPINGVILTISAQDLIVQSQRERETHVAAARRRLDELNRELRIQLPVYLMVTKCDLVAGFTEYFDDLAQDARAQVWGVTFPIDLTTKGRAAAALPAELDALMKRLNERLFARVEEDHDIGRRTRLFAFPQQMAALRDPLNEFVGDVFASTRFDQQILLRGVYFTSGTQEGTPIDRLLGALGRRFAVAPHVVAPQGRGKAYFIEHLLKHVLLAESGLAGVNRRFELQKAAAQLGAYAAIALVTVAGVVLLTVSYRRNKAYIEEVDAAVATYRERPVLVASSLDRVLPRLDAVSAMTSVATQYDGDTPFTMRWGLYQGGSLSEAAREAYGRELSGTLLSGMADRFRQRLFQRMAEPDAVFVYLKGYLMLTDPPRLDKEQLAVLADYEWAEAFPDDEKARESFSQHFRNLLDRGARLRAVPRDDRIVAQARTALKQASIPGLIYGQLKLAYTARTEGAIRLDTAAGLGADQVLRRTSGESLARPVPAFFTKPVFLEIAGTNADRIVSDYQKEAWVWGDEALDVRASSKLKEDVLALYEQDYIDAWQAILDDVGVVPFPTVDKATQVLGIVAATTSPFRGLLEIVDENTFLVAPAAKPGEESFLGGAKERIGTVLNRTLEKVGVSTFTPGVRVTSQFAGIHQAMAGDPGKTAVDAVLGTIGEVHQQLQGLGGGFGQVTPLDGLKERGRSDLIQRLQQQAATLPPAVGRLASDIAGRVERVAVAEGGNILETLYQTEVLSQCSAVLTGKYPFSRESATEIQLADFGDLFGYGGVFDRFFTQRLAALVDTSRPTWTFRTGAGGASVGVSSRMLRRFEAAQRIREMFFPAGSRSPEVPFSVTPNDMVPALKKMLLEIDGQSADYQFGPLVTTPMKWPGPGGVGRAAVTFEYRSSGNQSVGQFAGPWAFFRLLEAAAGVEAESATQFTVTFAKGTDSAQVTLAAQRERNPIRTDELRRFDCGL